MKIAIHNTKNGFTTRWINYCKKNQIDFKLVNAHANTIIDDLKTYDIFLWHPNHLNEKDILSFKQVLFSLEQAGVTVFPNFNTGWHFDDKVAQKYLLEAINAPSVNSHVFYDKEVALNWLDTTSLPKVFKLRGGAGSVNVKLVKTKIEGKKLINTAFSKGFKYYDALGSIKERYRKFKSGSTDFKDVFKGFVRLFIEPQFSKFRGKEIGYVYFQDFIPNNTFDIRIIVIGDKAFGIKRFVRENDFRASGSGKIGFDKETIDDKCVKISFDTMKKLNAQCLAFDFVFDKDNNPLIVEVSFGFSVLAYDSCPGYWDTDLNWHQGNFIPQDWIIEDLINNMAKNHKL